MKTLPTDKYNIERFGMRNGEVSAVEVQKLRDVSGYYVPADKIAHVPSGDDMFSRAVREHEASHSVWTPNFKGKGLVDQLLADLTIHLKHGNIPYYSRRDELILAASQSRTYGSINSSLQDYLKAIAVLSTVRSLCILERPYTVTGPRKIRTANSWTRTYKALQRLSPTGVNQARNIIGLVAAGKLAAAKKAAIDFMGDVLPPPSPSGKINPNPNPENDPQPGNTQPGNPDSQPPTENAPEPGNANEPSQSAPNSSSESSDGEIDGGGVGPVDRVNEALTQAKEKLQKDRKLADIKIKEPRSNRSNPSLDILPLTDSVPRNIETDKGRTLLSAANSGLKIRTSKLADAYTNPNGPNNLFKLKSKGGTILLDMSGSMRLNLDDVQSMLAQSPAATIAGYAGDYGSHGKLALLAQRGYMLRSVPYLGGGNTIDFLALQWLHSQPQPHAYIGDLQFTDFIPQAQSDLKLLLKRGLKIFESIDTYLQHSPATLQKCPRCGSIVIGKRYCPRYCGPTV